MHWRVGDLCQRAAPDIEAVRCTGGLAIPEMLHPTLMPSDALAILVFFLRRRLGVFLAVSATGVVASF